MSVIAHISDVHFGRDVSAVMEGLLSSLQALQPDLIILSGDLTQRAQDDEYAAGVAFLQRLPAPYFIIPGNHDMSATNPIERFFYTWDKWQKYIGLELEPVLHTDHFMAVGINTAQRMAPYLDWSRGRITPKQIARVQQHFHYYPDDNLRIVVAHHPFWLPPEHVDRHVVENAEQALTAFQDCGVDLVLSGHIHLAYYHLTHGVIVSHAGTSFSDRLLEGQPNSFNVIRGDREQLAVDLMEWRDAAFTCVHTQQFRHRADGWYLHE